jgi:hypothetical protein
MASGRGKGFKNGRLGPRQRNRSNLPKNEGAANWLVAKPQELAAEARERASFCVARRKRNAAVAK